MKITKNKFIKIFLLFFLVLLFFSVYVISTVIIGNDKTLENYNLTLEIIIGGGGPGFQSLAFIGEAVKIENKGPFPPKKDNIQFLTVVLLTVFFGLFFYIKDRERKREKKLREEELKLTRQRIKLRIEENI